MGAKATQCLRLARCRHQRSGAQLPAAEERWVLKADAHRGAGVHVLPLAAAAREARRMGTAQGGAHMPYDFVQEFVRDQFIIDSRRFYIRCC